MRRVVPVLVAVVMAILAWPAGGQEPSRQVSQSDVDLVTITVFVVDGQGRPVTGLAPEDFVVELDGERRPVRSLEYRQMTTAQTADAPGVPAATGGVGTGSGRVFTILFDDLSFASTSPDLPALREALERFVARLAPEDRVGVATTSGRGPRISPTADHARIATAVRALAGLAPQRTPGGVYVSFVEAIEISRSGFAGSALKEVGDRECPPQNIGVPAVCQAVIEGQARVVLEETRDRTATQLRSYEAALASLANEPRPRILTLVAGGLAAGSIIGLASDLDQLSRVAAESNTQLYAVIGGRDQAVTTEVNPLHASAEAKDIAFLRDGVESMVATVGGGIFRFDGAAARPFERMLQESSGVYEVGVDAPPGGDTRLPEAVVSVNRRDVTVRANRRALVPAVSANRPVAADEIRRVLTEGGAAVGVPVSVATSVRRAPASRDLQLSVDLSVPDSAPAPLEVAYAVVDADGRTVESGSEQISGEPEDGKYRFTFSLPLEAGRYALRVAVADSDRRVGGVEHPVTLELTPMGRLLASSLLTDWIDESGTRRVLGSARLPASAASADVALELYTADQSPPSGTVAVQIDLGQVGQPRPFASATFEATALADRWQVRMSVPVDGLDPGLYALTATVLDEGKRVGLLAASLEKTAVDPGAETARFVLPSRGAVLEALKGEVQSVRRAFSPAPLLSRAEAHAGLVSLAVSSGEALPPELEAAGESDNAWWEAVGAATGEPDSAVGAFARGLVNLRLSDAAGAITAFELALARAPASAAALRYLGAAHAAGGNDRDAAGAWQFALGTEEASLDWHLADVDTLVRIGDWSVAFSRLRALQLRFPESLEILTRQVETGLAAGRIDETRPLVARLLELRPGHSDGLWWQLVLAFADAVVPDEREAAERFLELAGRYLDLNLPRADLVRSWIVAVSR
jgi:VWFA-related protein